MRKKWQVFIGCFVFALLLVLVGKPDEAYAASYKTAEIYSQSYSEKERTANGVTFEYTSSARTLYAIKNGKKTKVYKAPKNYSVQSPVLTDGSNVYLAVSQDNGKNCLFYRTTIAGKSIKKIADVYYAGWPEMIAYYRGRIYYVDGSSMGSLICLNVAKGKTRTVYDDVVWHGLSAQNGKYIYFSSWQKIFRYDMKTGKRKTIAKNIYPGWHLLVCDSSSGYIYYVKVVKSTDSGSVVSVIRCKSDGSQKKTMVKNIKVSGVTSLTSSSVTYSYGDDSTKTKTIKF